MRAHIILSHLLTETLDEAFKWMNKIDKFEQKHFALRPEYRVIGDLMNRLKVAEGKDKFILQQKLNRAMRLVEWKEAYDPNNPANYGVVRHEQVGPDVEALNDSGFEQQKRMIQGGVDEDEIEFDDMKERDDMLLEQLNAIDKKLEEKLADLDHTFGKKGKLLEEEIRDLAEERNSLTEKKRRPLYRKVSSLAIQLDCFVSTVIGITEQTQHIVGFHLFSFSFFFPFSVIYIFFYPWIGLIPGLLKVLHCLNSFSIVCHVPASIFSGSIQIGRAHV